MGKIQGIDKDCLSGPETPVNAFMQLVVMGDRRCRSLETFAGVISRGLSED